MKKTTLRFASMAAAAVMLLGTGAAHADLLKDIREAKKIRIDSDNTTIIEGAGESAAIQGRIEQLTTYLIEQLELLKMEIWTPKEKSKRAGIVFFKHPAAKELYQTLQSHQIYTGNFLGGIRLDVHVFNTTEEIDKMLDVIKAFVL